jgi:hypothetical protein
MSEGPEKLLDEEAQKDLVRQGKRTVDNLSQII